jgi:hypothetical protein
MTERASGSAEPIKARCEKMGAIPAFAASFSEKPSLKQADADQDRFP